MKPSKRHHVSRLYLRMMSSTTLSYISQGGRRGGKQQLSHQTSIKTQSEHKQTRKVWLEMVDAHQATHHFSHTEGLKSQRGGEVISSVMLLAVNIDAMMSRSIHFSYINTYLSHRSISSQSSSIAGDEAVLFILMITALQQTDQEGNKDENSEQKERKKKEKKNSSKFSLCRRKISLGSMVDAHVITLSYLCKKPVEMKLGCYVKSGRSRSNKYHI